MFLTENIECSPEKKGRTVKPECNDIYTRVRDKKQAQQIHLILESFHNANVIPGVVRVSASPQLAL